MKSNEFISEDGTEESRFRDTFNSADVLLQSIQIDSYDDDWVKISAKGVEHFRAGTQEKIQFKISCWWNPKSDEAYGKVLSQAHSRDKKYSKELDANDDQDTLSAFAYKVNTFVTDIAMEERDNYANGEKEYWAKGGTGMMPGSVTRK